MVSDRTWKLYLYHFNNSDYGYMRNNTFVSPKHYCGITNNIITRDKRHKEGKGSRFINSVYTIHNKQGNIVISINCNSYKEARKLERVLKATKNLSRFCPCCNTKAKQCLTYYKIKYSE
jgi:predicted GIY-YIG superfamily endonuclease